MAAGAVRGGRAAWRGMLAGFVTSFVVAAATLLPGEARAGAQQYEELSASVRSALAAAIADRRKPEPLWESMEYRVAWLTAMSARLPRRHQPTYAERRDFLYTVRYEAQRAGLEPELVLALIQVESGFRRHAISSAGARGYMQVMPFWTNVIGDGNPAALFDMVTNIRYGCVILRHYLDIEKGNLFMALGRYNGSRGRDTYPNAVLAAWKRWRFTPPSQANPPVNPPASPAPR